MEQEPDDLRSLSTSWGDRPDEPAQDISFRGKETIKNLYIDVERAQWDDGLAKQPVRDLRKNKRFAELRADPWKFELAVLMVRFARSSDVSSDTWPYERFEHKLNMGGTPIPYELDVPQAIAIVSDDLRRLAPATANTKAWYEANIERPLAQRATQTRFGASHLDDEQTGTWLRRRTIDVDLEELAVTATDIERAPAVIAAWRRAKQTELAQVTEVGAGSSEADDSQGGTLRWTLKALATAEELATLVAADSKLWTDFRAWIRDISERDEWINIETATRGVRAVVIKAALDARQVSESSPEFSRHCEFAASLYLRALGIIGSGRRKADDQSRQDSDADTFG